MVLKGSFKHPGRDGVKIMFMELFDGELEEFFVRLVEIDEMVMRLEKDLTRNLLTSNGGSGQDGLDGEWLRVLRAVDDCDEEDEWVYGRVLCISGDDVYEMEHDTGEVSIRVRVELDGAVVHENDALGRTILSQSVFFQSRCSCRSYS